MKNHHDSQAISDNLPHNREEIEAAFDALLADPEPISEQVPAPPPVAVLQIVAEYLARLPADEAKNAKRLHTRNKRRLRDAGAVIDEFRKTPEGKSARNTKQRASYAAEIEETEHRPVRDYTKNPTPESRRAQEAAASKTYRAKKKAEKEAKQAAEAAEKQAELERRALF